MLLLFALTLITCGDVRRMCSGLMFFPENYVTLDYSKFDINKD